MGSPVRPHMSLQYNKTHGNKDYMMQTPKYNRAHDIHQAIFSAED